MNRSRAVSLWLLAIAGACAPTGEPDLERRVAALAGSNLAGSNLAGVNLAGSNLGGVNLAGSNLGGVNLAGTVGFGSLTFARWLGQQSAASPVDVQLAKLADRFPGSTLQTWQAVVRGDRSTCVFLLPAPVDATPAGVAGFVKAVFRWHAPPAQEIFIDAPGLLAPARYTGMMNAATHWRSGRVGRKSFLAGELAFVTANTNDRSVLVDFASWMMDSTRKGLVLGDVEAGDPPSHAESVYYAVENDDGTVAIEVSGAAFADDRPGVIDSYHQLDQAWRAYRQGARGRPEPRRCGAALWLRGQDGLPPPPGMCDDGLVWSASGQHRNDRRWSSEPGTTAPMNAYMLLPGDARRPLLRARPGAGYRVVLSETYVHMWDRNFD